MNKRLFHLIIILVLASGISVSAQQNDADYGLTADNPILVGGKDLKKGPEAERNYLDNLSGPNGEEISYKRIGSCCEFETPNGILGGGMLDKYEVTYPGLSEPFILYINMYDPSPGEPKAPQGLKLRD